MIENQDLLSKNKKKQFAMKLISKSHYHYENNTHNRWIKDQLSINATHFISRGFVIKFAFETFPIFILAIQAVMWAFLTAVIRSNCKISLFTETTFPRLLASLTILNQTRLASKFVVKKVSSGTSTICWIDLLKSWETVALTAKAETLFPTK